VILAERVRLAKRRQRRAIAAVSSELPQRRQLALPVTVKSKIKGG
jgi:hypothetical protein